MKVLETERLQLRWFTLNDAAFILELVNDPDWIQYIGDRDIHDIEAAQAYLEKGPIDMYSRLGFGLWMVERKSDGLPIGMCGILKRDSLPDVDVGYAFLPKYRGQGYAKEAVLSTLQYGVEKFGFNRILAVTATHNYTSIKLLGLVGMKLEKCTQLPGDKQDTLVFAWEREEKRTTTKDVQSEDFESQQSSIYQARTEITQVIQQFYAAFDNKKGRLPQVAQLVDLCLQETILIKTGAHHPEIMNLQSFISVRNDLLTNGSVKEFEEFEVAERTKVVGYLAQRVSLYFKSGISHGEAFTKWGIKTFQLVKTQQGFKISAVAWDDERPFLKLPADFFKIL